MVDFFAQASLPLWGLLMLGGLIHAFDADHLVAVTGGAAQGKLAKKECVLVALRWAVGHGLALLLVCGLVILLGVSLPENLGTYTELLVGIFLLITGVSIVWVWYTKTQEVRWPLKKHRSSVMGLIQGVAGSAPLLIVLPLSAVNNFGLAVVYIILFTVSVAFMMCVVGGVLGAFVVWLKGTLVSGVNWLRFGLGLCSVAIGVTWIIQV
ncbi:hypothetical protein QSV34_13385 [Porticoccus sp. W117]|uniref:HoxN/HupN/NixA family nickel/cobalt transporter n=1 Tax=Porticoccus sp. W117 TaxID=3054777 RepID=UPI002591C095|nr:hypothetical protein [Porticoccus sp. W117]MDM3872343.1 hypothetical protein [Porticoccus sp. W117]